MSQSLRNIKLAFIPISIAVGGLLFMSSSAYLLEPGVIPLITISAYKMVNLTFTMQLLVLPVSFSALALMYLYHKDGFKTFFRPGIAFSDDNGWNYYGLTVAVWFTLGTIGLMSFGVISQKGRMNSSFFDLLPLVILVAATNAWYEEIFSRFVIVAGLYEKLSPNTICWISAVIFGAPHFFGTPSGVFGVVTSGLLGWILAKSVIETKGIGWALLIHFLQDIVIFGAGAMVIAGQR
jgi:membrane protease YdiL (CAAX protease family)